ncbi:MAG: Structural maintenance of chromosomes protein 6 [Alectoria fallacina]|uniref:Structural maintenance of chromosomes protein 6 n=1 Tax=Alectoria fallacina TaxID=1903189 RepID=A0A8H3FRK5_9LECA|nr:MAG: Structural maintenance of chromosomes protein 6 [Alectoria fallacina]
MAPKKRQRSVIDNGDIEVIEVESAQSSLQQTSRKKPRVSYEKLEDVVSDEATDEELLEAQATQFVSQQRNKKQLDNEPAENGILEIVTCTNFMCHGYLEIGLGPLINFIIGHNGSGKSAVLTAITICLGGKATATNRGGSLKAFIKEGEESSTLSVKIKNGGDSAYQHEVYGDAIIVERHFSRSGSSSFKLKSSTGRLISTRKGDLEEICDYFALQIDNPMNVLTQDMARQFLNNSTPYDKYKFFMKGTQLEHLDGDYLIVEQNLDTIDQDLWKKQEDLKVFEDRAQKARTLLALSERQDTLRDRIRHLSEMMAWVQVQEQEERLAVFDRKLSRTDEKIAASEMKAVGLGEAFSQTEQLSENADRALEGIRNVITPLQEEKDKIKEGFDKLKAEALTLHTEQRQISEEIKAADERIKKANIAVREEHKRLSDADGGSHDLRRAEIEEKRAEASAAKARFRDHENELPALEDNRHRAEQDHRESQNLVKEKKIEVQNCEERLNSLVRDRGQQQQAYPPNMSRLLSAIRQDNGFQQRPVGPIANYVRLLKPLWSSILEKSFGGALDSFIVTSKDDQLRLSGIMQRVGCPCSILIGNENLIDTTDKEPDPRFDTALRVLEFDNELSRKQLIIGQSIDQSILIQDRGNAIDTMNGTRLQNVKQCFTLINKTGEGLRMGYGYGGGLSQSHVPAYRGPPRMKTDIEYQINSQRDLLQSLRAELNQLERSSQEKQKYLTRCEQAIVKNKRDAQHLRIEMQQAETIVDELQDALDQDAVEEGRLDVLKDQLREANEEKSTHEASYGESIIAKDKNNELLRTSREQMASKDVTIEDAKAKVRKAESKASKCASQRSSALRDKNAAFDLVETEKLEREQFEIERDEESQRVDEFTRKANDFCPRVPVDEGETGDSIDLKLDKLNKDLKDAEKRAGGSRQQIAADAVKVLNALNQAKAEVESIEELAQLLKHTLVNRKDRWRRFQKHITSRARVQFFYLLSERGFRGKLLAHHKEKKLDLMVEPDGNALRAKGRDTKGLSGGEKSFSTICLLLSMWEAMGAPIRCLDEFDVFMDSVNRDVSMEMMIKFARGSRGKQFILSKTFASVSLDAFFEKVPELLAHAS